MRILDNAIAPVGKHGTHNVVVEVVLVVRVDNGHDGLLVLRIAYVWCAVQVPYYVACNLPCGLAT